MPNSLSAKKRLRQSKVRRAHNRSQKTALRSQIRKVREAVAAGEIEKAETEFRTTVKKLDRAGAHKVIHPNTAARLKSRLSSHIKTAKQSS